MKCPKCGNEYSPKVWKIHVPACEESPKDIELDALRKIAKERGIERYWLKSRETIEAELLEGDE